MVAAHAGLGVMIVGIVAVTSWRQEIVTTMKPGDTAVIAGYTVTFEGEVPRTGPNYTAESGRFRIARANARPPALVSERRRFRPGDQTTTEAGIRKPLLGDLYIVMGDAAPEGGRVVRIYFNPLVSLHLARSGHNVPGRRFSPCPTGAFASACRAKQRLPATSRRISCAALFALFCLFLPSRCPHLPSSPTRF